MPELNFDGATEVILGGVSADKVYLGSELIWSHAGSPALGGGSGFDRTMPAPAFTLSSSAKGVDLHMASTPLSNTFLNSAEVEMEESTDGGSTWLPVGFPFPASQSSYAFTPANRGSLQYRARFVVGARFGPWSAGVSVTY